MHTLFVEIAGWTGALLILAGYALLSSGRVTAKSPSYQWINVVGAAGFVISGLANRVYPVAGLNIVWMGIGIVALWKIAQSKGSSTSAT